MKRRKKKAFPRSDAGNGELLASLNKDELIFDHSRRKWLLWRGQWWSADVDGKILLRAKAAARYRHQRAKSLPDEQREKESEWAAHSESRPRMLAALECAASEPALADSGQNWDTDPWLLGVKNGVVDLRKGQLRDGRPQDRISIHSGVGFDPKADCPRFKLFLSQVFDGQAALIDFIQRAVGYTLTGDTSEQCLFMCFGEGSNGKTTLFEVFRQVLGDYATDTPFSTFEDQARSSIPNDIAALKGRRLVTASETNNGTLLNTARIKALTGGDKITARFLYGELFSFRPVAKFWLAFNHKPQITDNSYGLWRRVRLIPFLHQFGENEQDKHLLQKLYAEAPGVLNWMIEGCLRWRADGFNAPPCVIEASQMYREECDRVGEFIQECCELHPSATVSVADLYEAYQQWDNPNGESTSVTNISFKQQLETKGIFQARVGHQRTRMWSGLRLLKNDEIQTPADKRPDADNDSGKSSSENLIV